MLGTNPASTEFKDENERFARINISRCRMMNDELLKVSSVPCR